MRPYFKIHELLKECDWYALCHHTSAIYLLEENWEYIDWKGLSSNCFAWSLLLKYPEKINWMYFDRNRHPEAISFMKQHNYDFLHNQDSILSLFKINIMKQEIRLVNNIPNLILPDPIISMELDYDMMKEQNKQFSQELINYVCLPDRLITLACMYGMNIKEYISVTF